MLYFIVLICVHILSSAKLLLFLQIKVEKLTQNAYIFAYVKKKVYLCTRF